jgi:signal peptidase I
MPPPEHSESFRETAESIIVAFILAFVFRAFVVEAFVIPTGSMAPTLYGKHGTLACQDCGWENAYGLTDQSSRPARFGPGSQVRCQNCNHVNTNLAINDGASATRGGRASQSGNAESGDRILVFKWPLDLGFDALSAHRWDVTVFKNPARASENFIKRLVGLPDEILEIIDGDVYTVPRSDLSASAIETLDRLRRIKFKFRSGLPVPLAESAFFRRPLPEDLMRELSTKLTIARKTDEAQSALWINVYDHDYPPYELDDDQPRWMPIDANSGWTSTGRELRFTGGSGSIFFAGKPIADHNAYNIGIGPRSWHEVSDVRLEAVVIAGEGDGYVEFEISKRNDTFSARFWRDGRVELLRSRSDTPEVQLVDDALIPRMTFNRPVEIAFENVDYRVSVYVDGARILGTTREQYAPDIPRLRSSVPARTQYPRFNASDLSVRLLHVTLLRDVFYTSPSLQRSAISAWADAGWGTTNHPILIRDDEYFMLGDNSPASKDSRLWDVPGSHLLDRGDAFQLGTVPKDQLVGRAFFVYWPSGLRPEWMPVLSEFGVIPNVGRMRWIR